MTGIVALEGMTFDSHAAASWTSAVYDVGVVAARSS
jgi:hypothetical protein